jgi:hypothetical protein
MKNCILITQVRFCDSSNSIIQSSMAPKPAFTFKATLPSGHAIMLPMGTKFDVEVLKVAKTPKKKKAAKGDVAGAEAAKTQKKKQAAKKGAKGKKPAATKARAKKAAPKPVEEEKEQAEAEGEEEEDKQEQAVDNKGGLVPPPAASLL